VTAGRSDVRSPNVRPAAILASVALVATLAGTAVGWLAGHDSGQREVWQYIGPGDVTCDTDMSDVPDCWELPDHPGQ
jgi:hypothetical protein